LNGQNSNVLTICADQVPAACNSDLFYVTGTASNVCGSSSATFSVVTNRCTISIPNVITPDGDSHNNNFVISGLDFYRNVKFNVYDRWGNIVYTSEDYRNDWAPADEIADGTYYYTLKLPAGEKSEFGGSFTVLRSKN
jgi:gliding motility-associated-like protein